MKRLSVTLCLPLVWTLAACRGAPQPPPSQEPPGTSVDSVPQPEGEYSFSGGDGTSLEQAIVVSAPNEHVGIAACYGWIKKNYPGARTTGQTTLIEKGRYYDAIEIRTASNESRKVYFDITGFFGKF